MKVNKFILPNEPNVSILMPPEAKIIKCKIHDNQLQLWVITDQERIERLKTLLGGYSEGSLRHFCIVHTDEDIKIPSPYPSFSPIYRYIGSDLDEDIHIFEVIQ